MTSPTVITDTSTLAARCKVWADANFLTVDTEFMREDTYYPKLCLVQVGTPDEAVAIDPLADGIDLAPLFALLVDHPVPKVFHAARQDVEVLFHLSGKIPTPLFDTQIAAMVCGFGDAVGYETLASKLAGARIDKTLRFTDWSRRPLSERQLLYALSDVTHLRVAYERLEKRLEKSGRRDWLAEEFEILTDPKTYEGHPEEAWRRIKVRGTNRRFLALLRELAAWREREAQARDVPRNRVVREQVLTEVAAHRPQTREQLAKLRSVSDRLAQGSTGDALLKAVERGLAVPDDACPSLPQRAEKPPGIGPLIDLLKVLLKMRCEEEEVAQKLVANVEDLERIACEAEPDVRALAGWRRDVFGADALALKAGRLAMFVDNGRIRLSSREDDGTLVPLPPQARRQSGRSRRRRASRS